MSSTSRIDVHHHFIPPKYEKVIHEKPSSEWPAPNWSVQATESLCADRGISTAILSLTSPGVDMVSSAEEQLEISRDANDYAADIRRQKPESLGFFATIPNPVKHPDEAIAELARAFDELHADGITLMTSYDGKYLGNEAYGRMWEELNKRKAVVFIHPTSPANWVPVNKYLFPPALDFTFETTKTAVDIIMGGVVSRCRELKIILSHGGGTLPFSWHRVAGLPSGMGMTDMSTDKFHEQARSFYYDLALTGWSDNIELLLKFAKPGHVLYGSDFPYAPNRVIKDMTDGADKYLEARDKELRDQVNWKSALDLFPRLKEYRQQSLLC